MTKPKENCSDICRRYYIISCIYFTFIFVIVLPCFLIVSENNELVFSTEKTNITKYVVEIKCDVCKARDSCSCYCRNIIKHREINEEEIKNIKLLKKRHNHHIYMRYYDARYCEVNLYQHIVPTFNETYEISPENNLLQEIFYPVTVIIFNWKGKFRTKIIENDPITTKHIASLY